MRGVITALLEMGAVDLVSRTAVLVFPATLEIRRVTPAVLEMLDASKVMGRAAQVSSALEKTDII